MRPVLIVSQDAINKNSNVVIGVPCTTYRPGWRIYSPQVQPRAGDGRLDVVSVARGEQVRVVAKTRLGRRRGILSPCAMSLLDNARMITLDLPGKA